MNRLVPLVFCAAWLCAACAAPPEVCTKDADLTPRPLQPHPTAGFLAYAHAHNDYEHDRPLEDALERGFHSVEADVYFSGGAFEVSHYGFGAKGTLEDLYLKPLQAKVDASGSVQPSGAPFTLWIDFKEGNDELPAKLQALFERYPLGRLATDGSAAAEPAVTVVLTGDAAMKEQVADLGIPWIVRDSNHFTPEDPPANGRWTHYALNWSKYVGWNGDGNPPPEISDRLACISNRAHALGRKVRFYGAPDHEGTWKALADYGIDFVGTDDLAGLSGYLEER